MVNDHPHDCTFAVGGRIYGIPRLVGVAAFAGVDFRLTVACNALRVGCHLLDEWVIIQLFRVRHLTVYDASFLQRFTDRNGINVVEPILFFFCIEAVLLDKLRKPALDFGPGQGCPLRAVRTYCERGFAVAAVKRAGQPCGGIFLPRMGFHVADNGVLALKVAVPCANGVINVIL